MKRPHQHLLRVTAGAESFAPLFEVASAAGLRVGWLALGAVEAPAALASAVDLGALRAVAVGNGQTVAVKSMRGAPVLRDLLREHFRGCVLILIAGDGPLVAGSSNLARLVRTDDEWEVWIPHADAAARSGWSTRDLVSALRRPRPW